MTRVDENWLWTQSRDHTLIRKNWLVARSFRAGRARWGGEEPGEMRAGSAGQVADR